MEYNRETSRGYFSWPDLSMQATKSGAKFPLTSIGPSYKVSSAVMIFLHQIPDLDEPEGAVRGVGGASGPRDEDLRHH